MKKLFQLVVCVAAAAVTTACFGFERKSTTTGPSAIGTGSLMGSWSSSNLIPSPGACTDFKWNITEQTGATVKGSFSASCAGGLKLSGTAEGALSGSTIDWRAKGVGSAPGLPSCDITLGGKAELGATSIRVPYSGDTCLGKVNGVEVLNKK